jgi:hypothetical protein
MSKNWGFSVRIFIPTGDPEGLRIIEKSNWTGQGLMFPRALFPEVRQRPELGRTGVYVLWGPSESGQLPRVYVGEGDFIRDRLDQHYKQKDFWTHAIVFISKDENLNKAHVQYLEARLVALAKEAGRAELDNGNVPQLPSLSEADRADAEGFLADMLLCLPILGVNVFEKPKIPASTGAEGVRNAGPEEVQELFLRAKGVEAQGVYTAGGFIVRAGSRAAKKEAPSLPDHLKELRRALVENGTLQDEGDYYRLTQDYAFNSPSMAAGVLLGNSVNGRQVWKNKDGRTLKELEESLTG